MSREKEFDFAELKKQVHGKNEEFVNCYLADILAKTEGEDFHLFLQKAAVYRIPLPASAFACFGGIHFLKTAASLTLMEKEIPGEREPIYWVTPVIREQEFSELEQSIRKETHKAAYEWYDSQYEDADEPVPEQSEEAIFHALACGNVRGACKHGVFVGDYKDTLLLYREKAEIQETVAQRITKEVIDEVKKEDDKHVAILLNDLGSAWDDLVEYQKAIEFFNKSLAIDLAVFGENHSNVATDYNNLGSAWYYLGEHQKAIEFYNKALAIDMAVFWENHPKVAIAYNNLGSAWDNLGEHQKAIEFFKKSLAIDLAVFGENHPKVARSYNNLGMAWKALGEHQKAIEFYNKALAIFMDSFGPDHPGTKTVAENIEYLQQ